MHVEYSDRVKQRGEDFVLLQQATNSLEEVLGPRNADKVKAVWDRSEENQGTGRYTLWISDGSDSATRSFDTDELTWSSYLKSRLGLLWDDILRQRGERHFQRILEMDATEP